jgi:hypothetical protein
MMAPMMHVIAKGEAARVYNRFKKAQDDQIIEEARPGDRGRHRYYVIKDDEELNALLGGLTNRFDGAGLGKMHNRLQNIEGAIDSLSAQVAELESSLVTKLEQLATANLQLTERVSELVDAWS